MNAPVRPKDLPNGSPASVTTGPVQGSRKVYAEAPGRPDIRVPYREIALSDPKEEPVRVYDPRRVSLRCASPGSSGAATRR
jgi:phosphomethylpyrimidine synthase